MKKKLEEPSGAKIIPVVGSIWIELLCETSLLKAKPKKILLVLLSLYFKSVLTVKLK